jgi:phage terminase small subunit
MPRRVALTDQQKRFVGEYLVDLNAWRAAVRAGYSPKSARSHAYQMLRRPHVAEAIAAGQAELAAKVGISVERIIMELARIGFSDIREAVQWRSTTTEGEGREASARVVNVLELKKAEDLAPDIAAAIAEISQLPNGGLRVKLHDKLTALAGLGRHLGMFADRREQASPITVEIVRFGEDRSSNGAE